MKNQLALQARPCTNYRLSSAGVGWAHCLAAALALFASGCTTKTREAPPLRFSAQEGAALNEFYRQGPVAAHLVATSGRKSRIVVAFPAGNSGTAVWFEPTGNPLTWQSDVKVESASRSLPDGAMLHGITAELSAT